MCCSIEIVLNNINIISAMADMFSKILSAEESLFINEMALDHDYLPKELPHRENQQHYLASCIKLLLAGRMGKNLLITGSPGIGKTAAVRWVLREMEEKGLDEQVKPIYVNCWKKDTAHKILLDICSQLSYKWVQNKNTDELFKEVAAILNKKAAVIVLDEVDKLESEQAVYQLLEDINRKCIFLITNEKDWLAKLDSRLRSRLTAELMDFRAYSLKETEDILKARAMHAFAPNAWEDEALSVIAECAYNLADIRAGLFLLREAGNIAEAKFLRKIGREHAELAVSRIGRFKPGRDLNEEEQHILDLVKENAGKTGTEIYNLYKEKEGKSYRTFHRKVKALEEAGLIDIKGNVTESGGRNSVLNPLAT